MKKALTMLLFLGLTTSGYSQKQTLSGKAVVYTANDTTVEVNCEGDKGVCMHITPINAVATRVEIPSIKYDRILIGKISINGQSIESLPAQISSGNQHYLIEVEKSENTLN